MGKWYTPILLLNIFTLILVACLSPSKAISRYKEGDIVQIVASKKAVQICNVYGPGYTKYKVSTHVNSSCTSSNSDSLKSGTIIVSEFEIEPCVISKK